MNCFFVKSRRKFVDSVEGNKIKAQTPEEILLLHVKGDCFHNGISDLLSIPHGGVSRKQANKWENGWHTLMMKSSVSTSIQNTGGSIRKVHINRLQHRAMRDNEFLSKAIQ